MKTGKGCFKNTLIAIYTKELFLCALTHFTWLFIKVFEKALDEPKYSSMYAQLCLQLSEEAPNFDDPGKTGNSVSKYID